MESPLCPPPVPGFRLIETMRWEPGAGLVRRDRHLARLRRAADRLGLSPQGVDEVLSGLSGEHPLRVRLTVDKDGQVAVTSAPFQPLPPETLWRFAISDQTLRSDDPWLGVKTTQRQIYDDARAKLPEGVDELIFLNERGELCEGTITNLFVDRGKGLLTPSLASGVLPGILREELIAKGEATEAILTPDDLAEARALYVGNSLRGLIPAQLC